jgi:hypothetical protein
LSTVERTDIIAELIREALSGTDEGHCVRVDFLDRAESLAVCQVLNDGPDRDANRLTALVLRGRDGASAPADADGLLTNADQAIERRNRKQERLCLFVPSDVVDAAASSLGNAFAPLDGRELHAAALERLLGGVPADLAELARRCFARLRGRLGIGIGDSERLDLLEAALRCAEAGQVDRVGLELWRLGLLPDARSDFVEHLEANGRHVLELSRPLRLSASVRERIQKLGVDAQTAAALLAFLDGRPLHDARSWARELAETPWTLDRWVFPALDRSDLRSVTVKPFVDANGVVRRTSKLRQPDGPAGALIAGVGSREKLRVEWTTDPLHPTNLARWRVEIVPVSGELDDTTASLPSREVPGQRDKALLSLDLDLTADELPNTAMWARVVPLDAAGSEIEDEHGELIVGTSEEFYLGEGGVPTEERGRLETVPTLAFGRLKATLAGARLEEQQPQWVCKDLDYFTLRLSGRALARIGIAAVLRVLESQVLTEPRQGGRYRLDCEDAAVIGVEAFAPDPVPQGDAAEWAAFWRAREAFFQRVRGPEVRNLIEVADWTPELAGAAVRYAQAYRELVVALSAAGASRAELFEALSLDCVLVRSAGVADADELALLVLPTHPLRAAWYASYSQLLARWELELSELDGPARPRALELELLEALAPSNTPPFAYWPGIDEAFVFFQNLRFFYGVALPASAPDPHRRFADLAYVLGVGDDSSAGDLRPERLANHLSEYRALHPYARRLELTLVNPDRGELVADTLEAFLRADPAARLDEDEGASSVAPSFAVNAYVSGGRETPLRGLERVRRRQSEDFRSGGGDLFAPAIESSVRTLADLDEAAPVQAHVAIASDLAQPRLVAALPAADAARRGSFSLHGLIARFVSEFSAEGDALRWIHRLAVDQAARPEPHPAGARFGEAVMDLQGALLAAGACLLKGEPGTAPALQVQVSTGRRRLLEALHQQSDWVVTVDRFFGPDFYDSPREPHLAETARKYVLDYTPDFGEGLGHRVIVTTAWQAEVVRRLRATVADIGLSPDGSTPFDLLEHLKMVSGRLALRALAAEPDNAESASLAATIAWLRARGRLAQAVLVPINLHGHLLGESRAALDRPGTDACDAVLVMLRRNIVEATFIGVRWLRGATDPQDLAYEMLLPLERAGHQIESRFFDENRVEGALQRARLASVLRFYFERSQRYGLFEPAHQASFMEHLARLEKTGLDFRPSFEGYIVTTSAHAIAPFTIGDARFKVLRPGDLEHGTGLARRADGAGEPALRQSTLEIPDAQSLSDTAGRNGERLTNPPDESLIGRAIREPSPDAPSTGGAGITPPAESPVVVPIEPDALSVRAVPAGEPVILLGHATAGDVPIDWRPSVTGTPHMFVLGIPGQGKSWTVARVIGELARQQVPALIFDFHGQFTASEGPLAGARQSTVLDAREGLPFSPFEVSSGAIDAMDWQSNAYAVAEIFAYVAKLGDMQRDVVYTAVRDAYRAHGFGGSPDQDDTPTYPTLGEVLGRIERQERVGRATNVAARCRPLLEFELFRPPSQPGTDLLSIVRGGLVLDLHRLSELDTLQLAAGAFVLRKFYKDMFSWGQADRLRLVVVLDEAHRLARDVTLPKIMKEGRKFGIAVVVASQGLADFHADVLGNVGTRVIFRVNHPESRKAAGFIRGPHGQDLAERVEQLAVGHAFVQTPDMRFASLVRMSPPDMG